jgi:hypothetical protein
MQGCHKTFRSNRVIHQVAEVISMRIIHSLRLTALCATLAMPIAGIVAQTPARDPSDRLRAVLPADVAERVIARIADARARELPAQALANRALKYASRGVAPADIERSISAHADRMNTAMGLLQGARGQRPAGDEVDAGAEALRQGVNGAAVSALAKSAPSGRSLAVPLFVLGGLVERGVPADSALAQVRQRLEARATDDELETMSNSRGTNRGTGNNGNSGPGKLTGLERAATMRPAGAGSPGGASGKAPTVPNNGGKAANPNKPNPPGRPDRP